MTKVFVMIGIAGSGKSTYVKNNIGKKDIRLSSDYIREAIPEIKDDNAEVFKVMQSALETHLKDGYFEDIYYDATNLNRRRRRGLYRNVKRWNPEAEVVAVVMSVPVLTARERNRKRDENTRVPDDVILRMHKTLQVPRREVDCDEIIVKGVPIFSHSILHHTPIHLTSIEEPESLDFVWHEFAFTTSKNMNWYHELKSVYTPHDCAPHHIESVDEHIDMCVKNADTKRLRQIALFHDLGKGVCKEIHQDGFATYRDHANLSAQYFLNYLGLTKYEGGTIPEPEMELVEVVHQHMLFHRELGKKNIKNNKLNDRIIKLGTEFAKIDNTSRIRGEEPSQSRHS